MLFRSKGQFGDIASLTTYIGGCLYGYVKINFPVTEVVKAIENGENKMIGVVEVEHIGCETVIRVNNEFLKCFPGSMVFLDPEGHLFYDLELGLFVAGYKRASIIENGTKVKILSSGLIGTVQGTDFENSEEDLSDLNYYIVPEGKTFNDELMVHKDDVFAFVF